MSYYDAANVELHALHSIWEIAIEEFVDNPTDDNLNAMDNACNAYFDRYHELYGEE